MRKHTHKHALILSLFACINTLKHTQMLYKSNCADSLSIFEKKLIFLRVRTRMRRNNWLSFARNKTFLSDIHIHTHTHRRTTHAYITVIRNLSFERNEERYAQTDTYFSPLPYWNPLSSFLHTKATNPICTYTLTNTQALSNIDSNREFLKILRYILKRE